MKLYDLLNTELHQLQQHQQSYQSELEPTSSVSVHSSPVVAGGLCTASSQPNSTPASCLVSANNSQTFTLPDVNISDLLSTPTYVHSPRSYQSPMLGYRHLSSTSLPASPAISASSQQLLSGNRNSKKNAGNKRKISKNSCQSNLRSVDCSSAANVSKSSVSKTLSEGDSRKRQNSRNSVLSQDSDDEFEDLHCGSVTKKLVQDAEKDESKTSCGPAAAADIIIRRPDTESCDKQCPSGYCVTKSDLPVTLNSQSVQRSVAQRLSKFAFKDSLLQQQIASSTGGKFQHTEQTALCGIGKGHSVALCSEACVCALVLQLYWLSLNYNY